MSGDERLRLFCALRLPADVVEQVVSWQLTHLHGGRIVPPENLHLTLAFLGHRPRADVPAVVSALESAADHVGWILLHVRSYRETRSVGMLTLGDEGNRVTDLAGRLHELLESAGVYRREERPWLPHLTVLRFHTRPRLRPPLPELGGIAPSDAAVFISTLRPGGARYEVLEVVALGGR